ncbi:unnamed protein product [Acanthoscelides obtectus]|uniref:DDE Tnp4 domain-containing protein n=1 Tax=Acanthoscelides obtectus TaxID=200917 RepID=A0A9P0KPP1_ACAOB|nr:unnamed protein product [Acanthoscelides obtectus]CAK1635087.1 hypothetical protein AOBTE_LOCUS9051 [Acanthoscelides obtectus]
MEDAEREGRQQTSVPEENITAMPSTPEEWLLVSEQYQELWNFPNCFGAMYGKHVALQTPINSGSEYYNYKSHCSIVLFALVDANYNFIFADAGCQGRISDGGVFKHSTLYKRLQSNDLQIPTARSLPGRNQEVEYNYMNYCAKKRSVCGQENGLQEEQNLVLVAHFLEWEDPNEFRALLEMDVEPFNALLESLTPMIQKENTVMRQAIPASIKLQVPQNYQEWQKIEAGFRTRWNFPGCYGAIDGKRIDSSSSELWK